jgi:hypothetical protein
MANVGMALEYARQNIDKGMTVDDANVELVRSMGFRVIGGKIPRTVRTALMAAVKAGRLGRLAKDGLLPEVFYHPNSEFSAKEARSKAFNAGLRAILAVCA